MRQFDNRTATAAVFTDAGKLGAAAILDQEGNQVAGPVEIRGVNHRATRFARRDQSRPGQVAQVKRHGVVRCVQPVTEDPRRQTVGASLHQQAKSPQPRLLGKRIEHRYGVFYIHMSILVDIFIYVNIYRHFTMNRFRQRTCRQLEPQLAFLTRLPLDD